MIRKTFVTFAAALLAVMLIGAPPGAPPASALEIVSGGIVIDNADCLTDGSDDCTGTEDLMFDITFSLTSQQIFDTFCDPNNCGLSVSDFSGITLDTTTWWTIESITAYDTVGADAIVFTVQIMDQSTGFTGGNDRIRSFGFNTNPDTTGAVAGTSGDIDSNAGTVLWGFSSDGIGGTTNLGGFSIEDCIFSTAGSCTGGSGGLLLGGSDEIELTLFDDFCDGSGMCSLSLDPDFAIKYQTALATQLGVSACSTTTTTNCFQESMEIAGSAEIKTPPPTTEMSEPGTLALFGIGLLGLGFFARRRRRVA